MFLVRSSRYPVGQTHLKLDGVLMQVATDGQLF